MPEPSKTSCSMRVRLQSRITHYLPRVWLPEDYLLLFVEVSLVQESICRGCIRCIVTIFATLYTDEDMSELVATLLRSRATLVYKFGRSHTEPPHWHLQHSLPLASAAVSCTSRTDCYNPQYRGADHNTVGQTTIPWGRSWGRSWGRLES